MTLKEFKTKHKDIILDELKQDDLNGLASGASLFYVSLSGKNRPKDDKTILWAGHIMTAGMFDMDTQLMFLRTTASGRATLDSVALTALQPNGQAMLFRTIPLAKSDPRSHKPWNQWD